MNTMMTKVSYSSLISFLYKIKCILYAPTIVAFRDIIAFSHLVLSTQNHKHKMIGIRSLGNQKLFARCGSIDFSVLMNVFYKQPHLPPAKLNRSAVILDLGSNIGYTMVHFKRLYPDAQVIGVEMDRENFKLAQKNLATYEKCHLLNCAVSICDGIGHYNKRDSVSHYHLAEMKLPNDDFLEIETITIDTIIKKFGVIQIDYAKIDIEGEENKIFKAENDLGWLQKVKMLNIETHGSDQETKEIIHMLNKHGFRAWSDLKHRPLVMAIRE